jgi:hypothetical protein
MTENLERHYVNEEEFLEGFGGPAAAAAKILNGDWQPNYDCDDRVRRNQSYFRSSGELRQLIFESADVYHDSDGFSSVQIVLCSSKRTVTVRVKKVGADLVAEKIFDRLGAV